MPSKAEMLKILAAGERAEEKQYTELATMKYLSFIAHSLVEDD
jgi:hypothetical protein|tara:strand:- start:456 stop:584 length:129 start_codon:yes stop_codon:yes gene_type:complete